MATKSISKSIEINDKNIGLSLASALENSREDKPEEVKFQRAPRRIEKREIKKFFGKDDK